MERSKRHAIVRLREAHTQGGDRRRAALVRGLDAVGRRGRGGARRHARGGPLRAGRIRLQPERGVRVLAARALRQAGRRLRRPRRGGARVDVLQDHRGVLLRRRRPVRRDEVDHDRGGAALHLPEHPEAPELRGRLLHGQARVRREGLPAVQVLHEGSALPLRWRF